MRAVAGPTTADVQAARRYGRLLDGIASGYRNPYTGQAVSGEALLLKLAKGESGFNSNADSGKAHGRTQFTPESRAEVIKLTGGKVDPWRSTDEAYHAAALHLLGKVNGSKGLEGYNPGMGSYPDYILRQKIGKVAGGGGRGAVAPAAGGGSTSTTTISDGSVAGMPQGSEGLVPALQALLQQPQQRSSAGLQAPAFSAAPVLPQGYQAPVSGGGPAPAPDIGQLLSTIATQGGDVGGQATGGSTLSTSSTSAAPGGAGTAPAGRGKVIVDKAANRPGVGLQKPVLGFLDQLSARMGRPVEVTTGTNHNRMTTTGNVSDHWDGNATDLGVGGDARQDTVAGHKGDLIAAHALQVAGGLSFGKALQLARKGGVFNFNTKAGRVQILWRTLTGGNHFNHVHVGVNPNR
jgi:hypothetical protein